MPEATRSNVPTDSVIAVIPARGGSKGVPGKNLVEVGGRSLLERSIATAQAAGIGVVAVSTDDAAIAAEARRCGALVVERPDELSGDTASSESALLHAIEQLTADGLGSEILVFMQCTSPFVDAESLRRAVRRVAGGSDCVFAARRSHGFLWTTSDDGSAIGINHDASVRLRRQDLPPEWIETGSFYVMRTSGFVSTGHRFFGRIDIEEVPDSDAVEIDTPADLALARALAGADGVLPPLRDVDVLVTDFDGVHTDDTAFVDQSGRETVRINRRDGHGVKLLREAGVPVLILSTETNEVVARRAEKLRVECLHGIDDKAPALLAWLDARGLDPSRTAYLGNDVNDIGCLEVVGSAICVADAHPAVAEVARFRTLEKGGGGAVREVAEAIIAGRSTA